MQYTVRQSDNALEIAISGQLTFTDAGQFPKVLAELANVPATQWVFDLNGLEFIDSTGMSLFVHVYDEAMAKGMKAVLCNAHGVVRDALDRAGFATLFDLK
ncbi:MAG: STAS domain-containing protein [Rhodospirillaceae bacterium]|nr:STAS domain-containing protein [Rhodospirillales bacterium]